MLIDYGDAVSDMTFHRGFSHSLLVLPVVGLLLWVMLRVFWAPVREVRSEEHTSELQSP